MEATKRWCAMMDAKVEGTPYQAPGNCSSYHKVYRADGTYTNRIHFAGMPSELHNILEFPIWTDFESEKLPEGVKWKIPVPPAENLLDAAYEAVVHIVE